jgi:hypothetical protein
MIDPNVQAWLGSMGARMALVAEKGSAKDMYEVLTIVAGQADKYVTPARIATERVTIENEGILT